MNYILTGVFHGIILTLLSYVASGFSSQAITSGAILYNNQSNYIIIYYIFVTLLKKLLKWRFINLLGYIEHASFSGKR